MSSVCSKKKKKIADKILTQRVSLCKKTCPMVNKTFFWFLFLTFYPHFFYILILLSRKHWGGGWGVGGSIHWQNDPSHHQLRTEVLKKSLLLVDWITEKNDWFCDCGRSETWSQSHRLTWISLPLSASWMPQSCASVLTSRRPSSAPWR